MPHLTAADRALAAAIAQANPLELSEADRLRSDIAYHQAKTSGALRALEDHRALQEQVQRQGSGGLQ